MSQRTSGVSREGYLEHREGKGCREEYNDKKRREDGGVRDIKGEGVVPTKGSKKKQMLSVVVTICKPNSEITVCGSGVKSRFEHGTTCSPLATGSESLL